MPAGIQVYNDSGIIQIDETSSTNLCLRSYGTAYLSNLTAGNNYGQDIRWGTITVPNGQTPFVVLRSDSVNNLAGFGVLNYYTSGTDTIIRVAGFNSYIGQTTDWYMKYWVFDKPLVSSTGVGLEVYDASGALKYTSVKRQIPIVGIASTQVGTTTSFPTGKTYAVNVPLVRSDATEMNSSGITGITDCYASGGFVSGGAVSIYSAHIGYGEVDRNAGTGPTISFGGSDGNMDSGSAIVVDVTAWPINGNSTNIA